MSLKKLLLLGAILCISFGTFAQNPAKPRTLNIEVTNLRNSKGVVQFALYNKDGTIPDEQFKNYFRIGTSPIVDGKSNFTFEYLPEGKYAVSILHDENENGKVDKGLIKPKEGIGFSNYKSIGFSNRPNFSKASFLLTEDLDITIKTVYM